MSCIPIIIGLMEGRIFSLYLHLGTPTLIPVLLLATSILSLTLALIGVLALILSSIVFLRRAVCGVPRIFPLDSGGYIWN